jgi:chromosome segregation ATPase
MVEANPTTSPPTDRQWDVNSLMAKLLDLQDTLLQAQEKNLMLSAQTRELERIARDAEDLKGELTAQGLLLTDKTRENKHLHQELSRVTGVLEVKLQEVEDLKAQIVELQHQLKTRESERDLLAVMLNEAESAQRRADDSSKEGQTNGGWLLKHFKSKPSG